MGKKKEKDPEKIGKRAVRSAVAEAVGIGIFRAITPWSDKDALGAVETAMVTSIARGHGIRTRDGMAEGKKTAKVGNLVGKSSLKILRRVAPQVNRMPDNVLSALVSAVVVGGLGQYYLKKHRG